MRDTESYTQTQEIPTVGIYGANTDDLFGAPPPTCEYRFCGKPIPSDRLQRHGKYCCDEHGVLERRYRAEDRKQNAVQERREEFREEAEEFLRQNPEVLKVFVALALFCKRNGTKVGAKAIVEVIRWFRKFNGNQFREIALILEGLGEIRSGGPYKLNDHYTRYFRLIAEEEEPELVGFFEDRGKKKSGGENG